MRYIKTYEANFFSNFFKGKNVNTKPNNKSDFKSLKTGTAVGVDLRELKGEKFDSIITDGKNIQFGYVDINNSEKNKLKKYETK